MRWSFLLLITILLLAGCTSGSNQNLMPPVDWSSIKPVKPKYEPLSPYGNPANYEVKGVHYHVLHTARGYRQRGIASWYGPKFEGHLTSTRETYNMFAMTAASPVLPIPCYVRVTNLENGKQVIVRVNDRGPFAKDRVLDLSYVAARKLGYARQGTALVEVAAIDVHHPENTLPTVFTGHPELYLQIGAFRQLTNAHRLQHRIQHYTHRPIFIKEAEINHRPIYRVQIGPLRSVDESDTLQAKLHREGLGHAFTKIT